jgi:hypothetical protein
MNNDSLSNTSFSTKSLVISLLLVTTTTTVIVFMLILTTIVFAQTTSANTSIANTNITKMTTTNTSAATTSPIDSFANPAGYSIAKKHIYDAPLLDVHFYCSSISGGIMATCLLFDGNSTNATLIGIEYIISSEQYTSLPEREKPNWTPVAQEEEEAEVRYPNLSPQQLQQLSEQFKDAYVKLIITWNPNDNLPLYPPQVVIESLIGGDDGEDEHRQTSLPSSNQTTS